MTRVVLVPFGAVAQTDLREASEVLERTYGVDTDTVNVRPLPNAGYDATREQYDVVALLDIALDGIRAEHDADAVLAVTNADIFERRHEFVSGSSFVDGGRAVVSTHRFGDNDYKRQGRIRRQTIKQFGHAVGLHQCDGNCVMQSVSTVDELDRRPDRLCQSCDSRLPPELRGDAAPIERPPPMSTPTFAEWRQGVRDVVTAPFVWAFGTLGAMPLVGSKFDSTASSVTFGDWLVAVVGLCLTPLFWLFGVRARAPTIREWVEAGVFAAFSLATLQATLGFYPILSSAELSPSLATALGLLALSLALGAVEYAVIKRAGRTFTEVTQRTRKQSRIE